jgi:copper(I)-binding protein
MEKLESVELPAGKPVAFEPGGLHIMVFQPQPVAAAEGATFPLEFTLESGATKIVSLAVGTGGPRGN